MNFIINLFKKFFFSFIFDIDIFPDSDSIEDTTNEKIIKDENLKKETLNYNKILNFSLLILSIIILIYFNNNNNISELQKLLDDLVQVVEWDLFRDIFINIQRIFLNITDKEITLHVLKEIHSFFLMNQTGMVKDKIKFDIIMKKIIDILSKN